MKKILIFIGSLVVIFLVVALVLFNFNKDNNKDKKLQKVKLADTTLTPKTYMS